MFDHRIKHLAAAPLKLNTFREVNYLLLGPGSGNPGRGLIYVALTAFIITVALFLCRLWNFHLNGIKINNRFLIEIVFSTAIHSIFWSKTGFLF